MLARWPSSRGLFSLLAGALVGCTSPPPPADGGSLCEQRARAFADGGVERDACPVLACEADTGMTLIVGTGRDGTTEGFTPLSQGASLFLIPGEQGLQHLLVGFRGRGFDGRLPLIEIRARRASDCAEVGYTRFRLPFEQDPRDPTQLAINGIRVLINDDLDRREYCSILGRDVDLVIEASTPEGEWAHREVRVRVPDIDPATRPELRAAWLNACQPRDGGGDAASDASGDAMAQDGALADDASAMDGGDRG
jgi:hypothetical protein